MKMCKFIWVVIALSAMLFCACSSTQPSAQQPPAVVSKPVPKQKAAEPPVVAIQTIPPTTSPMPLVTNPVPIIPPPPTDRAYASSAAAVISNTNAPAIQSEIDLKAQYEKYQKGQISKGQMMQAVWEAGNRTPQHLYGKVEDQYGAPVVGAEVTGSIELIQGFDVGEKFELHKTQTDKNGWFQFTRLKGSRLDATVAKVGYEINYPVARTGPSALDSSPLNRQVFTMWKLKGPEPMTHARQHAYIPCDGSVTRFDLLTGKKNANGDLIVKLRRQPVDIVRGKPFDWSATVEIVGGGLQPITDLYPNEAPATGYQSEVALNFPADMPKWGPSWAQSFYFQSRGGQVYGRMSLRILANCQSPPTLFDAEIYANAAGSRNLEWDPKKAVKPY